MFIRKKRNKGGSISVLLIKGVRGLGKKHSTPIIIKNFGSARNEEELSTKVKQAEKYKTHLEAVSPKPQTLKITTDLDIKSCSSFNTGFIDVYGKCFDTVFSRFALKPNLANKLRDLSIMRIADPASKLKTAKLAAGYEMNLKVDAIYKYMDQLRRL